MFVGFWTWAIWSCAEHWRGDPNYSYGWAVPCLALAFGLRRAWMNEERGEVRATWGRTPFVLSLALAAVVSALIFGLEFARQQMWHPQIVLELICLLAVGFSFYAFWRGSGWTSARAQIFPVVFFFTAVPWPARFEQPVTSSLMSWVATATAELLHWIGVEAQTSGGAIALRSGLVGITEACSGIRSSQAGIMFGLALGEWFLLRPGRRFALLVIAVALALLTNLGRTLGLALQAEWHGVHAVEKVHDMIGNVAISTLIGGVWLAGKLMSEPKPLRPVVPVRHFLARASAFLRGMLVVGEPALAAALIASLIAFVSARGLYAAIEAQDHAQTSAFFGLRADASRSRQILPVPKEIWNELRPTSGDYIRFESLELPRGGADLYHFFWKPSPWNRFALVHRPDICMPGVGWQSTAPPEPVEVEFDGGKVRCYLFRFRQGNHHAVQVWGVWRNGIPLSLDYQVAQVLGDAEPPPELELGGKRRSATEIVACSLISVETAPSAETAVAVLRSVFEYNPQ